MHDPLKNTSEDSLRTRFLLPTEPTSDPREEASAPISGEDLQRMLALDLSSYLLFIDFNCPFCFALHERLSRWKIIDALEVCVVEHASHVMTGPFDRLQEQLLAKEVFSVHHRAPDIRLELPPKRCSSKIANRLIAVVQNKHRNQLCMMRSRIFQALWQEGLDIGNIQVLTRLLEEQELPSNLLQMCAEDPPELMAWQQDWVEADSDCCIPVISHPPSGRVSIGLPSADALVDFFLGQHSQVMDSAVCYYQKRPVLLVCGWLSHLWPLLTDLRSSCEILQAPSTKRALETLADRGLPDLMLIEREQVSTKDLDLLIQAADNRSLHWAVATNHVDAAEEVRLLSLGAAEYLPIGDQPELARSRLLRVMRDRFSLDRVEKETHVDPLTRLLSRRAFIEHFEAEWSRAMSLTSTLALILLKVDGFNALNKSKGHLGGDQCLLEISEGFRREIQRSGDLLARFDTDEFAILLPSTSLEDALAFGKGLIVLFDEMQFADNAGAEDLKLQIGAAAISPKEGTSIHDLYAEALEARVQDAR